MEGELCTYINLRLINFYINILIDISFLIFKKVDDILLKLIVYFLYDFLFMIIYSFQHVGPVPCSERRIPSGIRNHVYVRADAERGCLSP